MNTLKTLLIATTFTIAAVPAAMAQDSMSADMGTEYVLDGATIEQVGTANSAMAVHLNGAVDPENMLPENIDDIRAALSNNTALTVFFEQNDFDAQDVVGVDLDEDGSLVIYADDDLYDGDEDE